MKNLFGIEKKKNYEYAKEPDGAPFIAAKEKSFATSSNKYGVSRTLIWRVVLRQPWFYVCIGALLLLRVFMDAVVDETLQFLCINLMLIPLVTFFVMLVRTRLKLQKSEAVLEKTQSEEMPYLISDRIRADIPKDALSVALLFFQYKRKGNKIEICTHKAFQYELLEVTAYVKEEGLFLFVDEYYAENTLFRIPLAAIQDLISVDDGVTVCTWNLVEDVSERYPSLGITAVGNEKDGIFVFPSYGKVRIACEHGEYEFLIAPYDVKPFADLLGLTVSEERTIDL